MTTINIERKIIFITAVKTPSHNVISTHIMALNLIKGIVDSGHKLCLLLISNDDTDETEIRQYLHRICDNIHFLPTQFKKNTSKYYELSNILNGTMSLRKYKNYFDCIEFKGIPLKIISHIPSFETVFWGYSLKIMFKDTEFYQYWSDPITLSGITPEAYGLKRLPFKFAEGKAIKCADYVIYGTKTLMDFEKQIFPKHVDKMRYIDIAYVEYGTQLKYEPQADHILYAGNYYSNIRNLQPLVDAVSAMKGMTLDIYGSGDQLESAENVNFNGRISPDELENITIKYSTYVCVLNHSCIQIPGKIFYDMNKPFNILVIVDGTHKLELKNYLKTYNRFILCENKKESIMDALTTKLKANFDMDSILENYSTKKITYDLLHGGKSLTSYYEQNK